MSVLGSVANGLGKLSPSLDTRLKWMRYRRGDVGLRLVDEIVRRGDFVIDVGAADGLYAARLSQLAGRRGRVLAFEPNPSHFALLEAATARCSNVTAYPIGLSDRSGEAQLHIPVLEDGERAGLGSVAVPGTRADIHHELVSVTLECLDAVLPPESPPVAFFKCDVEGHELAVLRGGEETLRRSRPKILVEIEQRHQDAPIERTFDYLTELGFTGYSLHESSLQPLEKFNVERDQLAFVAEDFEEVLPRGYVHDFLFVPPDTHVSGLMAAAARARS